MHAHLGIVALAGLDLYSRVTQQGCQRSSPAGFPRAGSRFVARAFDSGHRGELAGVADPSTSALTAALIMGNGCFEFPLQDPAQPHRGLDRHDLPPAPDELKRQPSRARADLDDPVRVARQSPDDAGMEPLRAD